MRHMLKKIVVGPIDWFVYTVLNEKQRRTITGLISENVKHKLKQLTSGGKYRAQRQRLQQIKRHLYNFGFMSKGLDDLKTFLHTTEDDHVKRLIAWELAQWYANDYSKEQAKKALTYLDIAKHGEKDNEQLRRIAIIEAEMYDILEDHTSGRKVINDALETEVHPDLYFALGNLEETLEGRLHYFNRVMALYDLAPITFKEGGMTYDDL
ncbi:hypothetical protein HNQ35_002706, partial [Cerasibacillus quisquiliarum]|nr:hypothetical protein [Cerasibacillus quisquiliarum]